MSDKLLRGWSRVSRISTAFELSPPGTSWYESPCKHFGTGLDSKHWRAVGLCAANWAFYGAASTNAGGNGFLFSILPRRHMKLLR